MISRFSLPGSIVPVGCTRPRGTSLLALGISKPGIFRYDLVGHLAPRAY